MVANENDKSSIRLDKWLWAARFYKTRAIARAMIEGGKVRYNVQRSKPGKIVEVGALISLWQGDEEKEVAVLLLDEQRRSAPQAQLMYQETAAYGHFGRAPQSKTVGDDSFTTFTWERTDKAADLRAAAGL